MKGGVNMRNIEKKLRNVHFACGGKETKLSSNEALNEIVKMLKNK